MRFVKDWDELLINYLHQCPNPKKSIITVYPKPYKKDDSQKEFNQSGPLAMCFMEFSKVDGLPRFKSRVIKRTDKL